MLNECLSQPSVPKGEREREREEGRRKKKSARYYRYLPHMQIIKIILKILFHIMRKSILKVAIRKSGFKIQ